MFRDDDFPTIAPVKDFLTKGEAYATLKSEFESFVRPSMPPDEQAVLENERIEEQLEDNLTKPAVSEKTERCQNSDQILPAELCDTVDSRDSKIPGTYQDLIYSRRDTIVLLVMEEFKKMVGSDSEPTEVSGEDSSESGSCASSTSSNPIETDEKGKIKRPGGGRSSLSHGGADCSVRKRQKRDSRPSSFRKDRDDDDDDDGNSRHPRAEPQSHENSEDRRCLACPYRKGFPVTSETPKSCVHPGFNGINRLKDHLFRVHDLNIYCGVCFQMFGEPEELTGHLQHENGTNSCGGPRPQPKTRFTHAQKAEIKSIGKILSEEKKWREIWKILFYRDENALETIPSPYSADDPSATQTYEDELVQHGHFRSEMLPQRVEEQVGRIVQIVLERVVSILPNLTRNILEENSYGIRYPGGTSTTDQGTISRSRGHELPAHFPPPFPQGTSYSELPLPTAEQSTVFQGLHGNSSSRCSRSSGNNDSGYRSADFNTRSTEGHQDVSGISIPSGSTNTCNPANLYTNSREIYTNEVTIGSVTSAHFPNVPSSAQAQESHPSQSHNGNVRQSATTWPETPGMDPSAFIPAQSREESAYGAYGSLESSFPDVHNLAAGVIDDLINQGIPDFSFEGLNDQSIYGSPPAFEPQRLGSPLLDLSLAGLAPGDSDLEVMNTSQSDVVTPSATFTASQEGSGGYMKLDVPSPD